MKRRKKWGQNSGFSERFDCEYAEKIMWVTEGEYGDDIYFFVRECVYMLIRRSEYSHRN